MVNSYYEHIPVDSAQEASILAKEYTWLILDVLRKSGPKGLTATDVHAKLQRRMGTSISASKVYALLKSLYENKFVHRYYDREAEAQRHTIGEIWGGIYTNQDYDNAVVAKTSDFMKKNLFRAFREYVEKATEELANDTKTRKWVPLSGPVSHCKQCHSSHEAEEFFDSLLDIASSEFVNSEEFQAYLKKMGYSGKDESEE